MNPTDRCLDRAAILKAVTESLAAVSPDVGAVGERTCLLGSQAVLDSVGFVTLLVTLEQDLGSAVDLAASFMAQGDVAEEKTPFQTVGSLADHIRDLIGSRAS